MKKKRLGEMLIEKGLMTEDRLELALLGQKRAKMKLGQYIIREGTVSETMMADIVSSQLKIERYHPDNYPLETNLSDILPIEIVNKYQAVPIQKKNSLLIIAMTDPSNIKGLDAIETFTGTEVDTVLCTEQELNFLITTIYGTKSGIGSVLGDIEGMQYISNPDETENILATEDVEVTSLQNMAEEAPVIRLVNEILSQAVREGASDVHISPEKDSVQIRLRVDGKLREVPSPPKFMILPIVSRLKILSNMDISVSRTPQDGRFTAKMNNKEINIRASIIPTIYGENMVLRILDTSAGIYELKELGMSDKEIEKVESTVNKPYGMILSTGPTGSGKTTTLYSILKELNQPDINIITLEDPVEYRIDKIRQTQLNRKAGMTFASGIRSILRQDPDVIMVGEIRDAETAAVAVQAALTGHKVLSTIHTNDAAGAITRLIDMNIESFLISSVMLLSIAQRLIRKVCPYCKESYEPRPEILKYWGVENNSHNAGFFQSKGCFNCINTGYKGRIGIFEVLVIDEMIQDMIIKNKSAQEINRAAKQTDNFTTLKEDVAQKIIRGITTVDEAASAIMA